MTDPSLAVQGALIALIKTLATDVGTRVYDEVPPESNRKARTGGDWPYITVGDGQAVPVDETCWDACEVYVQVDAWSREPGFTQVKRIGSVLADALHDQDLTISGYRCERMQLRSAVYSRDPDGETRRARLSLLIETKPL